MTARIFSLLAFVVLAACGGDDNVTINNTAPTAVPTATPTPVLPTELQLGSLSVTIGATLHFSVVPTTAGNVVLRPLDPPNNDSGRREILVGVNNGTASWTPSTGTDGIWAVHFDGGPGIRTTEQFLVVHSGGRCLLGSPIFASPVPTRGQDLCVRTNPDDAIPNRTAWGFIGYPSGFSEFFSMNTSCRFYSPSVSGLAATLVYSFRGCETAISPLLPFHVN